MPNINNDDSLESNIRGIINGVAGGMRGDLEFLESGCQHRGFVPLQDAKELIQEHVVGSIRNQILALLKKRGVTDYKTLADRIRKGKYN